VTEPGVAKPKDPRLSQRRDCMAVCPEQFRDYLRMGFALLLLVVSGQVLMRVVCLWKPSGVT